MPPDSDPASAGSTSRDSSLRNLSPVARRLPRVCRIPKRSAPFAFAADRLARRRISDRHTHRHADGDRRDASGCCGAAGAGARRPCLIMSSVIMGAITPSCRSSSAALRNYWLVIRWSRSRHGAPPRQVSRSFRPQALMVPLAVHYETRLSTAPTLILQMICPVRLWRIV